MSFKGFFFPLIVDVQGLARAGQLIIRIRIKINAF